MQKAERKKRERNNLFGICFLEDFYAKNRPCCLLSFSLLLYFFWKITSVWFHLYLENLSFCEAIVIWVCWRERYSYRGEHLHMCTLCLKIKRKNKMYKGCFYILYKLTNPIYIVLASWRFHFYKKQMNYLIQNQVMQKVTGGKEQDWYSLNKQKNDVLFVRPWTWVLDRFSCSWEGTKFIRY